MSRPQKTASPARAAALLAGLLCLPAAHAITGDVTVWWNTLRIDIVDTDLGDGITPQLSWAWQSTQAAASRDVGLPVFDWSNDWVTPGGFSYADATLQLSTHFDATALNVQAASWGGAPSATRIYRLGEFQLSGAGRVTFSVDMEAHVFATPEELAWHGGTYGRVWPYADANLFVEALNGTGQALSPIAYLRADLDAWGVNQAGTLSTSIELAAGQTVALVTQPGVVLNPVPEPGAWALLLAGLSCLGWAGRLRHRQGPHGVMP